MRRADASAHAAALAHADGERRAVAWGRGDLIAFPARKVWHRVMPTTAGLRKTLVVWAKDPTIVTKESEDRKSVV